MNILLDTHSVIWFITDDTKLPPASKKIIEDSRNSCFVSIATYWEMGIKYSLDRLDLKHPLEKIFEIIEESGFELLPITSAHILATSNLAFHHRDPFDRILIGQALSEGMKILSKDSQFEKYTPEIIWEK
ncbi:MAG: type II toxin-antitoxin system VapC family toxin [Bacteroidota bacterium]